MSIAEQQQCNNLKYVVLAQYSDFFENNVLLLIGAKTWFDKSRRSDYSVCIWKNIGWKMALLYHSDEDKQEQNLKHWFSEQHISKSKGKI